MALCHVKEQASGRIDVRRYDEPVVISKNYGNDVCCEGVMDIGVPASEGDMVTWIPGMKDMTPEEVSTIHCCASFAGSIL